MRRSCKVPKHCLFTSAYSLELRIQDQLCSIRWERDRFGDVLAFERYGCVVENWPSGSILPPLWPCTGDPVLPNPHIHILRE